ncbi:MAG: hypothetical protein ABW047_17385 [Nitrospiraceae bacterium]
MKFASFLTMKRTVMGCLSAGALAGVACADGRGLPTSPSQSATVSGLAATAPDNRGTGPQAAAPSSSESSPIHRLFLTKTCDANFPNVPICTVVTSEEGPLPVGTKADYNVLVFDNRMSGNVALTTLDGDTAAGHCTLSLKTGFGTCTFARGTGDLAGFHANVEVTFDFATGVTTWDGTYHFSGRD